MSVTRTSNNPAIPIDISAAGLQRERRRAGRQWLVAGLIAGDLMCVLLAMSTGFYLKFFSPLGALGMLSPAPANWLTYLPQFSLAAVLFLGLQLYNDRFSRAGLLASPLLGLRTACVWGALLALVSLGLKVDPAISRLFVLFSTCTLAVLLPWWRFAYTRRFIARNYRSWVQRQTLLIGWNAQAPALLQRAQDRARLYPLRVVGVVAELGAAPLPDGVQHWPAATELAPLLQARHYDEVIVAEGSLDAAGLAVVQQLCGRELIDFALLPATITSLTRCLHLESLQGVPLLTQPPRPLDQIGFAVLKRALDILGALVGLLLFAPVIALFAAIVYRESPGPVFFHQERAGRGGKLFRMLKIRSMRLDADKSDHLSQSTLRVDSRVLKIGALMRRLNIDELPQFWNVLKGEMSLVGPRPERVYHVNQLKSEIAYYNIRHTVKPGITGWAQVNGWRGDTCLQSRIACDLEYIESASLWFDIRILLMTVRATNNAY